RPIIKGDKAEVDFNMFLAGVAVENGQHQKYPMVIGENRLVAGFEEQLIGLKSGEQKEFSLQFPAEHFDHHLAGKEVNFKVEIKGVYERELPELNDEFAKTLGQFADLAALKKQISDNLMQEKKMKEEQRLEGELLDKLAKATEFDIIPDLLVKNETHKMLHEFEATIARQGLLFDDYLKNIGKTKEQLENEFSQSAEERVKSALITREIARQEKIEVREDELAEEVQKVLASYPNNPELADNIQSVGYQDYLRNILATRKVMELLKSRIVK
ncbi:MAG: trigger factor, partial [bacterium]